MSIEDEMRQIFSDSNERWNDLEQSDEENGDQNPILNQSLLKIFEERFRDLENRLAEENNAKKELQAKFKELEKNTELNNDINEIINSKINELEEVNRVNTESHQEQHEKLYKEIVKVKDALVSTEDKLNEHDSKINIISEKFSTIRVDLTKLEEKIVIEEANQLPVTPDTNTSSAQKVLEKQVSEFNATDQFHTPEESKDVTQEETFELKYKIWKPILIDIANTKNISIPEEKLIRLIDIIDSNKKTPSSISDIEEDIDILCIILEMIDRDTLKLDLSGEEGIKAVMLINKYKIKFLNVIQLKIVYNPQLHNDIKKLLTSSFPANLKVFRLLGKKNLGSKFNIDNSDVFSKLKIQNADVHLKWFSFEDCKNFAYAINYFLKAENLEFKNCSYESSRCKNLPILKCSKLKNIIFTNCWFNSPKILNKVLINSDLIQTLEKVLFKGIEHNKEKIKKLVEEHQKKTKLNIFEIIDD